MGKPGTPMQDRAVIREFEDALAVNAQDYALAIAAANPDLFVTVEQELFGRKINVVGPKASQ
jgi:hypothetical protein